MASIAAAAVAGTAAAAAYLDAKFHVRRDLSSTGARLNNAAAEALKYITKKQAEDRLLIYHLLEDHALHPVRGNNLFLEYENRSWTYKQFYDDVQRVGNWLINDLGAQKHEMVAIDGPNSAEYILLQFAIDGIGACVAHINCHLTGAVLVHAVKLGSARNLLAERGVEELVEPSRAELAEAGVNILIYDQQLLESLTDTTPLPRSRQQGHAAQDLRGLIYTSGTTGLPKGVMMVTGRWLNTAKGSADVLKLKPGDKFYTCLPLHHGAAQGLCLTPSVYAGSALRLGRKFSHKTFWPDVYAAKANRLQYVGELCRYLINAPVHPLERKHKLQEAWGNGMRPDVWEAFRQRFNIPVIHELYAATDGMGATFNRNEGDFSRGAIGVRGAIWHHYNGAIQVRGRIDPDTEDLIRGEDGRVVEAKTGEPGEVLHKIDPAMAEAAFRGYFKNPDASHKRWLRNVFEEDDLWFRSGDVMRQDEDGRVYFVDRLGDTYRWKSENVSTNEVGDVVGMFDQIAECNVYGVGVPHADGRCGCATIVPVDGLDVERIDFARLAQHVTAKLPRYAVPIFLRVAPQPSYTGTFKIQKGQAKREGVDLDLIAKAGGKDRVFWLPPGGSAYVPFERKDWEALKAGQVKL